MTILMVSLNSKNRKLGPGVVSTYRPVGPTCPPCDLAKYCYAKRGFTRFSSKRSAERQDPIEQAAGAPLVRHLVSGDVVKEAGNRKIVDRPFIRSMVDFHKRWKKTVGWMYTHAAERLQRNGFGPKSFPSNLHVLASCENLDDAKRLQKAGWRTARVTTERDRQPGESYCPYDKQKADGVAGDDRTNCVQCRLCFESTVNILFIRS